MVALAALRFEGRIDWQGVALPDGPLFAIDRELFPAIAQEVAFWSATQVQPAALAAAHTATAADLVSALVSSLPADATPTMLRLGMSRRAADGGGWATVAAARWLTIRTPRDRRAPWRSIPRREPGATTPR